jgi:MFS family permease
VTAAAEGTPTPDERLVTPDFVFATSANFLNGFGQQMLNATLPVYVLAMGGSQTDVGLVNGALAFVAMMLRPAVGWLADVWRRRPLVIVGAACYGLASIGYALAGSVGGLVAVRALHGFGLSNYTTGSNAYVADIAPPHRRAEAIGVFSSAMAVGMILGPAAGFAIVGASGFHMLFTLTAAMAFGAVVVSVFARERRVRPTGPRPRWTPRTGLVAIEALPIAWTAACLGAGFGPLGAFIAIYAQSRGIENPGLFFTAQAIAVLLARAFAGRIADRRGRPAVIVPGVLAAAVSVLMLPIAGDLTTFLVSAALFGAGFGAAQPATMALLVDRVGAGQRGLALSTYFLGFDSGIAVGSIGLGVVAQTWGFEVMWPIAAACMVAGLVGLASNPSRTPELAARSAD